MRRHVLLIAMVAGALWGCGLLPGVPIGAQGDVPFPGGSCENVPSAVCDEQMQAAANAAGGHVRDVAVRCTGACTRASGAGMSTVTMADGSQITRSWTYVGDPAPIPIPVCIGIAATHSYALLLVFFATMLWLGLRYSTVAWGQTTPVMQIPIGAVYLAMPIGFKVGHNWKEMHEWKLLPNERKEFEKWVRYYS
jgi:hypothetical protein